MPVPFAATASAIQLRVHGNDERGDEVDDIITEHKNSCLC